MHVHVTAYGDLRRYLPATERESGAALDLPEGATLIQLLAALHLPHQRTWLICVNDDVVDLNHALADGDRVELLLPIGGGL